MIEAVYALIPLLNSSANSLEISDGHIKMYETKAELIASKEELERILQENEMTKNQPNTLMEMGEKLIMYT